MKSLFLKTSSKVNSKLKFNRDKPKITMTSKEEEDQSEIQPRQYEIDLPQ